MNDFSQYLRFNQFLNKKILAIDFGTKVIGTATFCPGVDPFPLAAEKIINKSLSSSLKLIGDLIQDEAIEVIVLGVPFMIDGKETSNTLFVRDFGKELKAHFPTLEHYEQDETLTTKAAEERMKNSPLYNYKVDVTKIDCVSATIILEDFIRN